jgi:hypothetical protein
MRSLKAIRFPDDPGGLWWNPVEMRNDGDWLGYSERFAEGGVPRRPEGFQPSVGRG